MLVKVKSKKLVLGRTVYYKGDVFECRDAEAKLLKAGGLLEKDEIKEKVPTKESPKPPSTGISVTKKPAPSMKPERAQKPTPQEIEATKRASETKQDALQRTIAAAKEHAAKEHTKEHAKEHEKPNQHQRTNQPRTGQPVGAMMMPEGGAVVTGQPVAGAPSTATPALVPGISTTGQKD
jgi:hypothetical protein